MAKKGEILVDKNRHLCTNCKFDIENCDSDPVYGDSEEVLNVIKCSSFRKSITQLKRVKKGEQYWWFNNKLIPVLQIEQESIFDSTRSENGNYFYTEEDCIKRVNKIKK